ncbi:acetyl-CoA synthetase-like protein [Penicillium malachiteum]|uniref:acetyl-CoA synthetase-like protein n=1 Tax=Penicillium malachiteum TaxID=1324776 RepID=UPI002547E735|nr:acetyl-CoA synthetase-like protein [Penicillium malachiteum]KAJ5736726.1 acetyl-CoA synthetase-like protein [Penicillium malachiteum]
MIAQQRLLTKVVDLAAQEEPNRLFAVIPKGLEVADGVQNLTMRGLAQAVNFLCQWIDNNIGSSGPREVLAYMGSNDVRYCIFLLACQKTGHQAFLPSTRNSDEAYIHLLKATNCTKFFFNEDRSTRVMEIKNLYPDLKIFQVPATSTILTESSGLKSYPYNKTFDEVETDNCCIIHSSGTTGMPKPVPLTNGFWGAIDNIPNLYWPEGRTPSPFFNMTQEDLVLATVPFFHMMGLLSIGFAIFHSVPMLVGPDKPLSVEHLTQLMSIARPTSAIYPPSILEDFSHSEEALECLKGLKSVYYGGAPLGPETGAKLRECTDVIPIIGSSEIGWIPTLIPEEGDDWSYFEWNPSFGVDMQKVDEGLYEMALVRQKAGRAYQGIFHTFPELDTYRTKDIFTHHPTKPYLWKFNGRIDDVIVLSNGEKFNPTTMENMIEGHPLVAKAIVAGQSRFQACLLVEPNEGIPEMDWRVFIDEIWPTVQQANHTIAAHGRIMKNRIGLAPKGKTFQRTPKGSVQRRAVLRDFVDEINAIYQAGLEDDLEDCLPENLDRASVLKYTHQIISRTLERSDVPIDQDLYKAGFDSLMTIQVAKILQRGIQARQPKLMPGTISAQVIYANPTVKLLAGVVSDVIEGKIKESIPREGRIQNLVNKYTSDLPKNRPTKWEQSASPSTVILTGSTGSLGTYLLDNLLNTPSISKVYCFNRSNAEQRQKNSFAEKGLALEADWNSKVEFLQVSFGEVRFGLSEEKYVELLASVDTIIHNAWMVDFNHTVESFEEVHIQGVRRSVDFSLESKYNAHIHFVSSISTVGAWKPEMGSRVPEIPMENASVVLEQGYGESKHVAERICLEASRRSKVPTSVYRVGQIGGPTTKKGEWNRHEWLPTIIQTSKNIGKIPTSLGSMPVDWIPVDTLSSIVTEIVQARHGDRSELPHAVFHLTNPEIASWSSLVPAIQQRYDVEPVDFSAWVAELTSIQNPTSVDLVEKPALKLLGFYRGLGDENNAAMSVALDVTRSREASGSMKSLEPISAQLMSNWLDQWQF